MPTIDRDGSEIFFDDSGSGPCLVLGHSFLCSGRMWTPQLPMLSRTHRVLNLDLRGHGRSGPVEQPFTLHDLVDDVVAVLDHAGVDRAIWIGLSIGGMVALRAALTVPERVGGLVLADTDAGAERVTRRLRYRAMALGTRLLGLRPFIPAISRLLFGRTTRAQNPELVNTWKERFAALHVPSVLQCLPALVSRESLLERLHEIDAPTLILVGEEDTSLPPAYSRALAAAIRGSRLEVIERCGHLSALERPDIVNPLLEEFLAGVEHGAVE